MKVVALWVAALLFTLVTASAVQAGGGFPKGRMYMSPEGYARWQAFLRTGSWR